MTNLRFKRWIALSSGALLLSACGGGSSSNGGGMPNPIPLPPTTPTVDIEQVFSGVTLSNPVAMMQAPGDNTRWFVVEQGGRVRVFNNSPTVTTATNFIDISTRVTFNGETGLLGMAFHPNFPVDPRVFLFYSHTEASTGLVSRLSEFLTADGGTTLDPASERIVLVIDKPEDNHNGGNIAFGRDGFLYIGTGDGGGGNDQHGSIGNAQLLTTLLGKMLRIDVDVGAGALLYGIPIDNPFAVNAPCPTGTGTASCPEIFAVGFRNPWRWSFDRQNGDLWVGDVGQGAIEEVDRITLGGNYGWRCFEGTRDTGLACGSPTNLQAPVAEYDNPGLGRAVTGGYVYRGAAFSTLVGRYIFGDFGSGRIWNIANTTTPTMDMTGGFSSGLSISSFGEGNDGELYVVDYGGRLFHITD
jgi:glucose/arabinose dehydrogenase